MDQRRGPDRTINPRKNASILSVITFLYTYDIFKKGFKKELEVDDVYEVLPKFRTRKLGDELESHWNEDKRKNHRPSLYRLTWSRYGKQYLSLGALNVIVQIGFVQLMPQAVGKFVSYFSPTNTLSRNDAFYYGSSIIVLTLLKYLFDYNYQQIIKEFSIKVCTSFSSLLYRKALKLSPEALSDITMGKIVTLLIKDVNTFETAIAFFNDMWNGFVLMGVVTYLIHVRIGYPVFIGMGFVLVCIPFQVFLGKKTSEMRLKCAKKTDDRIQVTQEALSAIKIIKMYTWERFFQNHVTNARRIEIDELKKIFYLKSFSIVLGSVVTHATFCLIILANSWFGKDLDGELVYYILSCFGSLKMFISISIPLGISQSAELVASLTRLDRFMNAPELKRHERRENVEGKAEILMENVAVTLANEEILKSVSLKADKGLTMVTGNVGSGKSTLLKSMLGECSITKGTCSVKGTVSYASQEPWVFPSTVRQNIIFGLPFDEERYFQVLSCCALTFDINLFENGDQTIVGDKGLNLSKGQKARISLARCCYKNSDVYLLDDCLTALDANVGRYVFDRCIKGFLKDKIVIFVSHNPFYLREADNKLVLEEGRTLSLEDQSKRLSKRITRYIDEDRSNKVIRDLRASELMEETDSLLDKNTKPSKDVYEEKQKRGKVDYRVYGRYFKFYGGFWGILMVMTMFVVGQWGVTEGDNQIKKWVNLQANITALKLQSNNDSNNTELRELIANQETAHKSTFDFYMTLTLSVTVILVLRALLHFMLSSRASRKLHDCMVQSLLNSPLQFFDVHFIGNILNRFSKDLCSVDEYIPFLIYELFRITCMIVGVTYLISIVNNMYLVPAAIFASVVYFLRCYYIPTGRSLRRLDAITRSPMVGYLNATLDGLSTIRAYETEQILRDQFDRHTDLFSSSWYMIQCTQRAFSFAIDIICTGFMAIVIVGFFFNNDTDSGSVGMAITQVFMLTAVITWATKQFSELESQVTSVERVLEYTEIPLESKSEGRTVTEWPKNGQITFDHVNLVYETTNEHILRDISFRVEPGEKIGIVGRTGAGKSSIISVLFRLYNISGSIVIDGEDIGTLNLEFLRSSIAIIPQDPILFSGTIRKNIDPLDKYKDEEIWRAIRIVKLTEMVPNLEMKITESGSKYSSGQRQLICLARALVTRNKIIVLDEATANMDPETDKLLHETIRVHFGHSTVLTIAHRINTVIKSDKVLVVDGGRIVQYGKPNDLLRQRDGQFRKMASQAGIQLTDDIQEEDDQY